MALIADSPRDRVEQLLAMTTRLGALVAMETARIEAREPPLQGAEAEEKARLANAYRLELTHIKQDPSLIDTAPAPLLAQLRVCTTSLQDALAAHELALGALKVIAEGLVQAMAEEVARQRGGAGQYGARGQVDSSTGAAPALIDRSA